MDLHDISRIIEVLLIVSVTVQIIAFHYKIKRKTN